jgi:hypothetical protein
MRTHADADPQHKEIPKSAEEFQYAQNGENQDKNSITKTNNTYDVLQL